MNFLKKICPVTVRTGKLFVKEVHLMVLCCIMVSLFRSKTLNASIHVTYLRREVESPWGSRLKDSMFLTAPLDGALYPFCCAAHKKDLLSWRVHNERFWRMLVPPDTRVCSSRDDIAVLIVTISPKFGIRFSKERWKSKADLADLAH